MIYPRVAFQVEKSPTWKSTALTSLEIDFAFVLLVLRRSCAYLTTVIYNIIS